MPCLVNVYLLICVFCSAPSTTQNNEKSEHIEVQFQDSTCNFFCVIYFAEKFAWLRKVVLPIGEEAYLRSISRCIAWQARGGKSGSKFCKTLGMYMYLV